MYQKKKYIKGPLRGPCCIGSSTELLAYQQGEGAQSVFLRGRVCSFRVFEGLGFSACSERSGESLAAPVHVGSFGLRKGYPCLLGGLLRGVPALFRQKQAI